MPCERPAPGASRGQGTLMWKWLRFPRSNQESLCRDAPGSGPRRQWLKHRKSIFVAFIEGFLYIRLCAEPLKCIACEVFADSP